MKRKYTPSQLRAADLRRYAQICIIAGAGNSLGRAFISYYSKRPDTFCIALVQKAPPTDDRENVHYIEANLALDSNIDLITQRLKRFLPEDLGGRRIKLVYAIGPFKFDDTPLPPFSLDAADIPSNLRHDKIYRLNFLACSDLIRAVISVIERKSGQGSNSRANLAVTGFAPLQEDTGHENLFPTYMLAKRTLRSHLRALGQSQTSQKVRLGTLMVNASFLHIHDEEAVADFNADERSADFRAMSKIARYTIPVLEALHETGFEQLHIIEPTSQSSITPGETTHQGGRTNLQDYGHHSFSFSPAIHTIRDHSTTQRIQRMIAKFGIGWETSVMHRGTAEMHRAVYGRN